MTTRWVAAATLATGMMAFASPIAAQNPGAQAGTAQPGTQTSSTNQPTAIGDDAQFIDKMMLANMAEIQLGQLASTRAKSDEVKSYAQMMVTDHTKANQELQPLAQKLGRNRPAQLDAEHQAIADRLAKLQGDEFDREFMTVMVQSHKEALGDATAKAGTSATSGAPGRSSTSGTTGSANTPTGTSGTASSSTATASNATASPQSAAEYAAKTTPVIRHHLEQAERLQKSVDK